MKIPAQVKLGGLLIALGLVLGMSQAKAETLTNAEVRHAEKTEKNLKRTREQGDKAWERQEKYNADLIYRMDKADEMDMTSCLEATAVATGWTTLAVTATAVSGVWPLTVAFGALGGYVIYDKVDLCQDYETMNILH